MGAPQVIAAPTKSYVVINSIGSNKSIPPTICDLGRVSSLATAVTLSRTSNIASRNNYTQTTRSIYHKKRPMSEVLGDSSSKKFKGNMSAALSINDQPKDRVPHANGSCIHEDQSSISVSSAHSSPSKRIKAESPSLTSSVVSESTSLTSRIVSSSDATRRTVDNQKNTSVSATEKVQMSSSTQYRTSRSTDISLQISILRPGQVPSQGTEAELRNVKHMATHTQNKTVLPNQQPVLLLIPGIGKHTSQLSSSITMQLQQQNQQLRSENLMLQKQLSLFKQLIKNPQRLSQVLTRLEQSAH